MKLIRRLRKHKRRKRSRRSFWLSKGAAVLAGILTGMANMLLRSCEKEELAEPVEQSRGLYIDPALEADGYRGDAVPPLAIDRPQVFYRNGAALVYWRDDW
jgi:hypothetical protein